MFSAANAVFPIKTEASKAYLNPVPVFMFSTGTSKNND